MDQQLTQALGLHQQKRLDEALQLYEVILQQKHPPLQVFLNSSAILRSQGNQEKAIYSGRINAFPSRAGLWNNLGNTWICSLQHVLLWPSAKHFHTTRIH